MAASTCLFVQKQNDAQINVNKEINGLFLANMVGNMKQKCDVILYLYILVVLTICTVSESILKSSKCTLYTDSRQ